MRIVLLLDKIKRLYNYFPNADDYYWKERIELVNNDRFFCHYFENVEALFSCGLIGDDYKEDKSLYYKILNLSYKNNRAPLKEEAQ